MSNCVLLLRLLALILLPPIILLPLSYPIVLIALETGAFSGNSGLTSMKLPTPAHLGNSVVYWLDSNGNKINGGSTVLKLYPIVHSLSKLTYTLTDEDVVVTNGIIMRVVAIILLFLTSLSQGH